MQDNQIYYKNLPKKRVASGVLFFNDKKEILIVKPNYREDWLLPGGIVEVEESPIECGIRETKEEIGLDVKIEKLLCVHFVKSGKRPEKIVFVFYGGILSETQIKNIKIQKDEIDEYRFVKPEETEPFLGERRFQRTLKCLEALKNNTVAYLEN